LPADSNPKIKNLTEPTES